jgi:NADH-quinone oxidoreductase subunit M
MPVYAAILLVVAFSSAGLPGLNGFVGEFLILLGAFKVSPWMAIPAVPGIIIAAIYLLRMLRSVLFGPLDKEENQSLTDLNLRESLSMVPILVFIVFIGVYPKPFLRPLEPVAAKIEARMSAVRQPVRFVDTAEEFPEGAEQADRAGPAASEIDDEPAGGEPGKTDPAVGETNGSDPAETAQPEVVK